MTLGPNIDAITLEHLGADRMSEYGKIRSWESFTYAIGCLVLGAHLPGVRRRVGDADLRDREPRGAGVVVRRGAGRAEARILRTTASWAPSARSSATAPRFWGFLAALFLVWTGFNAAWNFISLKIASEGGGPWLVGIGTALGGLVEVPMMRSSSRLQATVRAAPRLRARVHDLRHGLPAVGPGAEPDDRVAAHRARGHGVQPAVHDGRRRRRAAAAVLAVLQRELGGADGRRSAWARSSARASAG